jgi:hypothetical protein
VVVRQVVEEIGNIREFNVPLGNVGGLGLVGWNVGLCGVGGDSAIHSKLAKCGEMCSSANDAHQLIITKKVA